jgi:kynurenine formamidase
MMLEPVDLTLPITEGMLTFARPWHTRVQVEQLAQIAAQGRETRRIVLGTHTGTHVDAPRHFIENGPGIDALALDALAGAACLLDFTSLPPLSAITAPMLDTALNGVAPARIVLRFGWDKRWGRGEYYLGHPYLTEDAAEWLVRRKVRLLGMDTPMPDNPEPPQGSPDSPIHKILLNAGVILLEYLCNLGKLRSREITLIALPLNIPGADGAPARCIAYDGLVSFA